METLLRLHLLEKEMILILIWVLYPIAEAIAQRFTYFKDLTKKVRPNYLMLWIIRGIAAVVHGALLDVQPEPWYQWPGLVLFQVGTFGLLFDPILNKLLGNGIDYEGENSGWLKGIPYWLQAIISVGMIVAGLYVLNKL